LLFGLFLLVSVVVIATHKDTTMLPGANRDVTDGKPTTTYVGAKPPPAGGRTTTTALGRTATTAKPAERTGEPSTSVPVPHVLFDIQGSGDDTIGRFLIGAVATPWDVNWSYNCSKLGKKASFNYTIVFIQKAQPDRNDLGPSQTGMSGAGVERYHDAGTFGITVATECSWTAEVSDTGP